jgi:glycosyltransferase involved in cell wall biosynthesis
MRKKILFYSDCEIFGGSERMLPILINDEYFRNNFEIHFSYRNTLAYEEGLAHRIEPGVKVTKLSILDPDYLHHLIFFRSLRISQFQGIFVRVMRLPIFLHDLFVLTKFMKKVNPELIHINNGGYPGALSCRAAVVAAKFCRIKVITMVVNNIAVEYNSIGRRLQLPLDKFVSKNVSLFITGSRYASAQLERVLRLEKSRTRSIWNGVSKPSMHEMNASPSLERIAYPTADFVVGMVAQLVPRKGHLVAIEAAAKFVEDNSLVRGEFVLLIEGTGPLEAEIRRMISTRKLEHFVVLVGVVEDISTFINRIDAMLLTSISNEDLPNVISEAMAFCKPVIASHLAGIPEQIRSGENGILCSPGNVEEFSNALNKLRMSPKLREEFGRKGGDFYNQQFTPEVSASKYKLEYDSLL